MKDDRFAVSIIVTNMAGVLTRISSLFSQRDFNIDTFTSGETENPTYARITITASGDSRKKDQLIKQISKLYDVRKVEAWKARNCGRCLTPPMFSEARLSICRREAYVLK